MGTDPLHAPATLAVTIRGRPALLRLVTGQVTATGTPGNPPPPSYWVAVLDGKTYPDRIPADPGDVNAAVVQARVDRWADDHPASFR